MEIFRFFFFFFVSNSGHVSKLVFWLRVNNINNQLVQSVVILTGLIFI